MSKFLIYKASAGSGKTYTLVKEYLKIVLNNPDDFRHTLAITFTNKAADEMKNRIVNSLIELSEGKNEQLQNELVSEGVTNLRENAQVVLNGILHKYYYFSVLTIDSFFQRIIRSFSKELNLYVGYTLEINDEDVMEKITDEVLDEIGQDAELTKFLEDYVYQFIDEEKGWKIDYRIKKIGMEIFKERYWELKKHFPDDVLDKSRVKVIIQQLRKIVSDFEGRMEKISIEAKEILEKYVLEIDDFKRGITGVIGYLCIKLSKAKKKYEPTKTCYEALKDRTSWYTKTSIKKTTINKAIDGGLLELLERAISLWESGEKAYKTARELLKTIHVLGVFKDLLEKLKLYRDENKSMFIPDANIILEKITSDMYGAPFLYEKIGNTYKYILIDEFQDTSTFQWFDLLPLIENSLAENGLSMVVGDVKQSIYRWRNGNMKLLLEKIYEHLSQFENVIDNRTLTENHRSRSNIVEFNNMLFSKAPDFIDNNKNIEKSALIEKAYEDCRQNQDKNKPGGYVYIEDIPDKEDLEIKTYQIATERVIEIIKGLQNENIPLKDILILTRTNKEASRLAMSLSENSIPVVSSDSLYLFNSPKVKLLISLLKYILDNSNKLAKTEALYNYSLINGIQYDLDGIFSDCNYGKGNLFNSVLPNEFFSKKTESNGKTEFRRLNPSINNYSLFELIESLIRIFGLTVKPDPYMMRFMDVIFEYSKKYASDISGFLDWWKDNLEKVSIVVPEETNAVKLMTIHKAKGLQSQIVIVPFVNWKIDIKTYSTFIWVSSDEEEPFNEAPFLISAGGNLKNTYFEKDYYEEKELTFLDNLNLLYVAFTRPIERLYALIPESADWTVGKMVNRIIVSDIEMNKHYVPEKQTLEIGEKGAYPINDEKKYTTIDLEQYISNDLYKRIIILKRHESLKLFKDKDFSDKTLWGNLVHKALSYINKPDDLTFAINCMKQEGLITHDQTNKLEDEINKILTHDQIKGWFGNDYTVKAEKNLLLQGGEVIRPDRVLIKDDKAMVIDYKTGIQKEEHSAQVNKYARALTEMGYATVEKYLLYIEGPLVKEIK